VLLLNSVLTVEEGQAASHQGKGWERFTDAVIRKVNDECESVVFMLWGSYAQRKAAFVDTTRHLVLKAPHPSPLSAHNGFFGCRHFSKANAFLQSRGREPIDWQLPVNPQVLLMLDQIKGLHHVTSMAGHDARQKQPVLHPQARPAPGQEDRQFRRA
jgi:hypothetical protein